MKILFLQKSNKYSGAENVVLRIMSLLPSNFETYYVSPNGPIKKVVEEQGFTFVDLGTPNLWNVRKIIKKIKPDVIHASDFTMSTFAAFASGKVPVISHLHSNPSWLKQPLNYRSIMYAFALISIKKVISVSSSIQKEYAYSFLLKNKNFVLNNVIDIPDIQKRSAIKVKNIESSDLIFLGRLSKPKNPLYFCKIIKEVKKSNPSIKSIMVGQGKLKDEIINYINNYDLVENIKLVGFKENPYPYILNSKIGIMPSIYEGFGLAAVEMLALGKPVLCNSVGGLRNIINNSCGCICVSIDDYVREIQKLLTNNEYYQKKSLDATQVAESYGDLKDYQEKIINIYKSVK